MGHQLHMANAAGKGCGFKTLGCGDETAQRAGAGSLLHGPDAARLQGRKHADGNGRCRVQHRPESAREYDLIHRFPGKACLIKQDINPGANGGLGQLDFAHILLADGDGAAGCRLCSRHQHELTPLERFVLVRRCRQNALAVGDTFRIQVQLFGKAVDLDAKIAGTFEYFPTWYPGSEDTGWLFVGNLENLYEQAGDQYPYDVWLRTDGKHPEAEMNKQLLDLGFRASVSDVALERVDKEQTRPERQGLFGFLSIGFAAAALLTVLGFSDHTPLPDDRWPSIRMEPWELPGGLWDLFANPRLMPHLHLPLQSGADSVLRRMARRCRTEEFARLASEARARVPGIHLTTDIIAGFPGETDAEWRQTLAFVASIGFGQVHIFAYSPRPGTKAASLPDQVPAEVKKERSREMHELERRMKADTFAHYLGHQTTILLEGRQGSDPDGDRYGYTPHYLPVSLPSSKGQDLTNQLLRVELTAIHPDGDSLIATLAPQTHPLPDHEDAGASPAMGTLVGPAPA